MLTVQSSLNLVSGKFLGSTDRILFAGNNPGPALQIHYNLPLNGQDGLSSFKTVASAWDEQGRLTALELCGFSRLGKTFAAFADVHNHESAVKFLAIQTSFNDASLESATTIANVTSSSAITSLAFNSDKECLAIGTEGGNLLVSDLQTGQSILCNPIDATGINKVKFTSDGNIAIVSNTANSPAKIFDPRSNKVTTVIDTAVVSRQMDVPLSPKGVGFVSLAVGLDNFQAYCGTGSGAVVAWDLRYNQSLHFQPHVSAVTDILVHPKYLDQLVTCSLDGSVKIWSTQNISSSSPLKTRHSRDTEFSILITQPCGFQALETDHTGESLLASTKLGHALLTSL